MKEKFKKIYARFFDRSLDFRVRLFHILGLGGIAVSFFTIILSVVMSMWKTAAISGLLVLLSLGLILFVLKTGKYQVAYFITIIVIFILVLPLMFFTSGGHRSGMPSIFLFSVIFTMLMLKGKAAIFTSLFEMVEYSAVCIFAYYNPRFVTHFESEAHILADTIFATTFVSLICGIVLFFHLREYDYQRELLREQNEKLRRYDASRSVFLTTVSHEIKNPLNAINLHARDTFELMDESPLDTNAAKENQQVIERMVVRIDHILTDLKDTVAIEQGRLSLSLAPMRLDKLLEEICRTYFGRHNTFGNLLTLNLLESLSPIDADFARLTQVVTNLLSNAIKHTKNGEIIVSLYKEGDEQAVAIKDNGEGMSKEIKEKVFKGYVSESKEYWRHGIGLYVSHQIIEAHGGRMWIESSIGKGTTVTFTLPERRALS